MLSITKKLAAQILEKHPYGYILGVLLLDNLDSLLPHEADYWAFPLLEHTGFLAGTKTILDIGANRGHSSRAFLKLLPGWEVIAFEANPLHQTKLEEISRRYPERFSFHISAVTDMAKGELSLFTPFYGARAMHSASALSYSEALAGVEGAFTSLVGRFSVRETKTPTISIDTLGLECSFVKIDIQGEELKALEGMSGTISRCQPIILVEMNLNQEGIGEFMHKKGYAPYIYDAVKKKGYPFFMIDFPVSSGHVI